MQTLPFWNSIEKCGLPALVYTSGNNFYSQDVLVVDGDGDFSIVKLYQHGPTDNPKLGWLSTIYNVRSIHTFTHWAYIPAVPKKEEK